MKLATIRVGGHQTRVVRVDGNSGIEIPSQVATDLGQLLQNADWRDIATRADGPAHDWGTADVATLVPEPSKTLCVGLNYRNHILEMGRDLPGFPTLFAKYRDVLIGRRMSSGVTFRTIVGTCRSELSPNPARQSHWSRRRSCPLGHRSRPLWSVHLGR